MKAWELVELPESWFPRGWKTNPWSWPGRWCLLPCDPKGVPRA